MTTPILTDTKQLFISYSRVDAPYARSLAESLIALDFTLWRDRSDLEGGENWWQQIEEAIRSVDTMLLLLSEAALASKVVSKEWRYARQVGTRVIPIVADNFLPEHAPRWMSKRDWYDFRRRSEDPDQQLLWEKLLAQLRSPYSRRRVPFMAEELPTDYVPRSVEIERVIEQLVDERREEPRAVTVALKGAGGYGKTTLARAICLDERVQAAFDDGVLWVTFGENVKSEQVTGKVDDLVYMLTGRHSQTNTLEAVVAELADAFAERDLLLVLDDVWNAADIKPFLQGGPRCARLITTRDAGTLPPNAYKVMVNEMSQPEAVALLQSGLPDGERQAFEHLAGRLGDWPLLIKLVNGALRDAVLDFRQPLRDALHDMNQGLNEGGLTVFDLDNTTDRSKAVGMTIELSLSRLSADEKARFEQLLIFPEDINVPLDIVSRLWGISGVFTRKLCGRLFSMSLLLDYNLETGTLRLHDIVRDYLRQPSSAMPIDSSTVSQGELIDSVFRTQVEEEGPHNKLLDSYQLKDWSTLPETDRYMWEYLSWHLLHARRDIEFMETVVDINYLAKKSIILNPFEAEHDLVQFERMAQVEEGSSKHKSLSLQFSRITHILARCRTAQDAAAVIWNRMDLTDLPRLQATWSAALPQPILTAEQAFPDLPPSALVRTIDGHRDGVKGIAFSPDGQQLVSVGDDRSLRLWHVNSGLPVREGLKVASEGRSTAWSADGRFIAVAYRNGELGLYDPQHCTELICWQAHSNQVRSVAIHPLSQHIVSGGRDRLVKVWDGAGALLHTLTGLVGSVEAVTYNGNGNLIAACDYNGLVAIWDGTSDNPCTSITIPDTHCYSIAFSPDSQQLAIGTTAGRVLIWDRTVGTQQLLTGQTGDIRGVSFSPDGKYLTSVSSDRGVVVRKTDTWSICEVWLDHTGIVRTVTWVSDGRYIATGSSDRSIKLWSGALDDTQVLAEKSSATYYSIAYTDKDHLIALEKSGRVVALDWVNNGSTKTLSGFHNNNKSIACSPAGSWILGMAGSASVKRWDGHTLERIGILEAEAGALIHTAAYRPDEQVLVTTAGTNILQLRAAQDLSLIRSWEMPGGPPFNHAVFSPDGETVAAAGADGSIVFWLPHDNTVHVIRGHQASVNNIAYSADGHYIASVSSDRTLRVLNAASGHCLHTFYADGGLYSLAWHPAGHRLVAGGTRGLYWLQWHR